MHTEIKTPWIAVVPLAASGRAAPPPDRKCCGDGRDVLLQGFHWASHAGVWESAARAKKSWYRILRENAAAIRSAGFSWVWFPPPSDSLAREGYIPRRWHVLDTAYGSENELRAAIEALGPVQAMADVVLNHRVGVHTSGADFADPAFPDNRAAITRDDNSGVGTGEFDTGESHPAGRDLDHTNAGVRATVKNYLHGLKSLGFKGWRYDLVKGYHGRFVGEYNESTEPGFSVGEYFDGDPHKVVQWLDTTGGRSAAFDFPTRYRLFDALQNDDYGGLRTWCGGRATPAGLLGAWPSRAVTFLDNHDTEYRRDEEHRRHHDGTRHYPGRTVEAGYAYLLTHPGVPCVFWSHFFDWGEPARRVIEQLIKLRKAVGVHSRSGVEIKEARRGQYAAIVDDRLALRLGSCPWHPGGGWWPAVEGEHYAVWARAR
jgi:alpha-amylase